MAIAIDDVEEALELVIRSLGAQFASVPGVAGAATTADGEAVVALDLNLLVASFAEGQATAVAGDEAEEERSQQHHHKHQRHQSSLQGTESIHVFHWRIQLPG